jgi:tetratricopeptide (TPR) repeat protein
MPRKCPCVRCKELGRYIVPKMQKQLTVTVARNVGALYEDQGKLDMAAEMFRRVLKMCDDAWSSEHTSTAYTAYNLGTVYVKQGKGAEAQKMYQRALQGHKKARGADHPLTKLVEDSLILLHTFQGKC